MNSLGSTKHTVQSKLIFWYTDNCATNVVVKKGSSKTHLHNLAVDIFDICSTNNINLDIFWIPRASNKEADKLSKDYDDWSLTFKLVNKLSQKWGKISVDSFASDKSSKCTRFAQNSCAQTQTL